MIVLKGIIVKLFYKNVKLYYEKKEFLEMSLHRAVAFRF